METAHLKAFLRIAETGSISRAAESLGIAQPSLSQQLLRLEDEIGFRLFDRTARGVTLTEQGRVFQERARQVLHVTDQAVADARLLRDDARGQVVFAMPPSLARMIGVELVETLADEVPLARVRVVEAFTGSIRGWLETEKIDLGVLYDLGPLRHLAARPLMSEELVVIGPRGRFGEAEIPLSAIAGEPLIAPGPQHGLRQLIDREAARAGIDLSVRYEIDALDTMIGLVERIRGLAIVPVSAAVGPVADGHISMARIGSGGLRRSLSLVRNPSHVLTHASLRIEHLARAILARRTADGPWPGWLETP